MCGVVPSDVCAFHIRKVIKYLKEIKGLLYVLECTKNQLIAYILEFGIVFTMLMYKTNKMSNQILEFYLSHHFMMQGWDRSIDTTMLYKILPQVTISKEEKKLAIITPSFLSKKGIPAKEQNCLVIVLNHKLLTTAFWCDHPNYLFKKEKQSEFQIIF